MSWISSDLLLYILLPNGIKCVAEHVFHLYRNGLYSKRLTMHKGSRIYLDKGKIGRLKVPSTGISSRVGSIKLPSETLGDGLLVSLLGKMASMILKLSLRLEDCEVCGKRLLWGWPLIDAKRLISIFWSRTPWRKFSKKVWNVQTYPHVDSVELIYSPDLVLTTRSETSWSRKLALTSRNHSK